MQGLYRSDKGIVFSAILIALAVRTLVISSSPTFILGGDTPGYVAFTKEIISNGLMIPGLNSLHFPGSFWVYPPLLPYFWSLLVKMIGTSTFTPFYVIEISGMVVDSLVIIPLFMTAKLVFGRRTAIISAFIFTVYLPDLYALTWGGVPQLFATFLFATVIYFAVRISKEEGDNKRNAVFLGITLTVLTFTHDLTIFVMLFSLILLSVMSAILLKFKFKGLNPNYAHLRSIVYKIPMAILIAVPALLVWYIPRYWWIIDAGAPYINTSLPFVVSNNTNLLSLIYQGVNGYLSPLGFAIFLIPLLIYSFRISIKQQFEKSGVLLAFTLFPVAMSILDFHDPTIVARMGYYSFLPGTIITAFGITYLYDRYGGKLKSLRKENIVSWKQNGKTVTAALVVPLLLVSALGVSANMSSHTFYNSYVDAQPNQIIDYSALGWIHSNLPKNSTFASFGEFGYYIMGYDGNPTLVYQNLKYLTQPVEWNESIAAYNLVYRPAYNTSLTQGLISKYNISYVTSMNGVTVPSFYKEVYSNENMTIYFVRG